MGNCKIALGTYELSNSNLEELGYIFRDLKFDYVDTSICYNNDYFLGRSRSFSGGKGMVISKIPPQMFSDYEFYVENHLRCLKRDKIDIMLIHNPRSDWRDLAIKLIDDNRFIEVGVSNFSIDDLVKYKEITGVYPSYNEIEINPEYYDKELIKFCKINNIKIISYAILGGKYNSRRNISRYTLYGLLSFAHGVSDIVIIRSDRYSRVSKMIDIINKLNITGSYYEYPKESIVNKSINPMVYNTPSNQVLLRFSDVVIPNYDNDSSIISDSLQLRSDGFDEYEFMDSHIYSSTPSEILHKKIKSIIPPSNLEFITDYRVYYRYRIYDFLNKLYPSKNYDILVSYEPDLLVVLVYKKSLFFDKLINRFIVNVSLYDKSTKKLSKIKNDNTELKVNYIQLNNK